MAKKPTYEELERRIQELENIESEHKHFREVLHENESLFKRLYEKAPLGYQSLDENGHFIVVNQTWLDTLGYSREEVMGKSFADFLHPDWRNHFKENFPRFKSIGEVLGVEFEMVKKNGELILVSFTGKISRDKKGGFQQTHCIFHDITDRKKHEELLERYKNIVSSTTDAIAYLDENYRYIVVNNAYENFSGANRDDYFGMTVAEYMGKDVFEEKIKSNLDRCLNGEIVNYQEWFEYPTKGKRFVDVTYFPYRDGENHIQGVIANTRDITERKRAEKALRESAVRLRQAQQMAKLGHWDWKMSNGELSWSDEVYAIFGRDKYNFQPSTESFDSCIHPDDYQDFLTERETAIAEKRPVDIKHRIKLPDGTIRYVQELAEILKDNDGNIVRISGTVQDITERKRAETYREMEREILEILNEPGDLQVSIQRVLAALKIRTGVDAAGLRLQEGEDFPYFVQDGFSKDFLLRENTLLERDKDGCVCRDKDGKVRLECTCGLVISGKTDPSNPLFTKGGSSWTNNSFSLLDLTSDQDPRLHPRNNCIHKGYTSVALIPVRIQDQMYSRETCIHHGFKSLAQVPVRTSDRIVGLIQLNDKRKGRFTLETIEILESIAAHVGSALIRKQAEEDLEKSLSLIDATMSSLEEGLLVVNMEGNVIRHNRAFLDLWKIPPELESSNDAMLLEHVVPQLIDPEAFLSKVRQLSDEPEASSFDEIAFADGRVFERFSQPLWQGSHIKGRIWCFRNITERKRAEEALRESEHRYRTILDEMSEGYHEVDLAGNFTFFNDAFLNLFGYSKEDMTGTNFSHYAAEESIVKEVYQTYNEIYKTGNPLQRTEWDIIRKDGQRRTLEHSAAVVRDSENVPTGFRGVVRDITEPKQIKQEREKLQAQLTNAQKMESIGSLAGGIAHDFNNLLFPILGFSEIMLKDFPPGSPEHKDAQLIFNAATRGRELVQQILSFSRQSEHQPIPVHIQKILKEVLKLCRATIPADIKITRDIQADCGSVMANPTQIHQIAMNLITNAFHAVESTAGTITVQLKETDFLNEDDPALNVTSARYAVLSISDTGTGIDPAVMNKIFDPYFTTKEKGRGTGLGLATVYGITKAHGGDIKVHSEMGKGSSFHVYLPLLEKTQESEPEKEMIPHPTGTEHILLVDDENAIIHLEKQMLERLGYHNSCFPSSRDALAAFKTDPSRFDLVITDMNMPQMTGIQLAKELVAIRPDIPIILCTGFSERINSKKAEALGIRRLLMKPVGMKDLAQKVREVLDTTSEYS